MTQQLEGIFGELGLSQYLDTFLDQGFDSWDTILDITESDLDALGVKLGHRRKLQRRIANSRGLAPDASLVSPTQPSIEDGRIDSHNKSDIPKIESRDVGPPVASKRKYRRHPKPDENAPERPPSAYVLFSNKMREDLKGRNLTFTEIAKLVGENWQSLSQPEKEPYESQAQKAKEKYNNDLNEYKKTAGYKEYNAYLQEFRAKYATQSEKDASKRVKLSDAGNPSHSGSASATPNRTSRSGSNSEGQMDCDTAVSRQQRVGSAVSTTDSAYGAAITPNSYHASLDDSVNSPTLPIDRRSAERSPTYSASPRDKTSRPLPSRRNSKRDDDRRLDSGRTPPHLPPLADMFDGRPSYAVPPVTDVNGYAYPRGRRSNSPGAVPGLLSDGKPPTLRSEQSSTGSSSSTSSTYPRTPMEGSSLPIHALLTSKPDPFESGGPGPQPPPMFQGGSLPADHRRSTFMHYSVADPPPILTNGYHHPPAAGQHLHHQHQHNQHPQQQALHGRPGYHTHQPPLPPTTVAPGVMPSRGIKAEQSSLDGMSALLRAGEIVNRRETE